MPQEWENGSAARLPDYEENNPFAPVDYASRLQAGSAPKRTAAAGSYQPGQLYSAPRPSAPPMAAPQTEMPSYLQPQQEWQPAMPVQAQEGAPYSAALFEHQATAVMQGSWDAQAFAAPPVQEEWQPVQEEWQSEPFETPVQPFEKEYDAAPEMLLRDPFTPAQPHAEKCETKTPPVKQSSQRPPVRLDRLLALVAAAVMLCVCVVVGGRLVYDLVQNENKVKTFMAEFEEENGMDVYHAGAKVDLLPEGQAYPSTPAPVRTTPPPTPSPTPIIPVYGALGLTAPEGTAVPESTAAPALRTRLITYPDNPMCNITESLRKLLEENSDVIGRLVIPGLVDEVVVQRNNTYYLTHDANGTASEHGAVFADQSCTLRMPPENLLLRGQGGVPNKVFAPLWQYVSGGSGFVSANLTAKLTTLYEEEYYVLFAVIVSESDASSGKFFNYGSNPTFTTDEAMMHYVESARQHSLYQFGVDVLPSDRLLTLATLGNGQNTLVLMYRMVRDSDNLGL